MNVRNLDIDLLRTFVTIADLGSFTAAGARLGRTQSTISLQVKRLEALVSRILFERTARSVLLTLDGQVLLGSARKILHMNDKVIAELTEPDVRGRVRLGVPEDFATAHLPDILALFTEAHPLVELEVTCDLTLNLLDRFHAGAFDLVLVKREPAAAPQGVRVWREPLVWVARNQEAVDGNEVIPLVVSPEPCVYRKRATDALDAGGRTWRIAYTSTSLAGAQAAVKAGLGISVLPKKMVPSFLVPVATTQWLPQLPDTEIALIEGRSISDTAHMLAQHIVQALEPRT
ncbi:LysR substrate-binding domain-containing protein [Sphingobium sp. CECT 9361]|uniref:LysR substrate-binding domain-containing protein n=1 Tax=Sphingobium sp. CECT 9361 TaxID=2845384 RepID=UPI001E5BCC53|nr:LysR substrate-binding domain-containing protein [Sphingobium sp. CECT 9361]CAH0356532.1 HTH-type transcriptional regulator YofA [Sphingobium sp. CECT 9361]